MVSISERLSKWAILSVQDPAFLDSVKLAYVCDSGNQAFLVTKDDDVYTIGNNSNGCSGIDNTTRNAIGGKKCIITSRIVEALCKKQITNIVCGSASFVLAVTESGKVYSWGYNGNYELGHGSNPPNANYIPTIITNLNQFQVKQVACGGDHSMALTEDGKVFTWGYNANGQLGNECTSNQSTPVHVALGGAKCESITCTISSSFAVTDRGKVYSWGYNGNGELGIKNNTSYSSPQLIKHFDNQVITKIVGGVSHVLAVTDDGLLYTWGNNANGQLGTGNTSHSNIPIQVGNNLGRFIEVASSIFNNSLSAAMLSNEKVYIWGNYMGKSFLSPVLSSYKQLDDVFSSTSSPYAMWRSLTFDTDPTSITVAQQVGKNFNDKENSDFEFVFSGNKGPIHAHKAILKIRSEYFNKMLSSKWTETNQNQLEIKDCRYEIFKAYIYYLYTNKVDVTPSDAVELMQLANENCEDDLKKRCEILIMRGITTDNALNLITLATTFNLKNLEEQCYNYAVNHLTAVINSDAFKQFDKDLGMKLFANAATLGVFKT